MKIKILIAVLVLATALFAQKSPPPPEPFTFRVCGPVVASTDGIGYLTQQFTEQGCEDIFVKPHGIYWLVYGIHTAVGIEPEVSNER